MSSQEWVFSIESLVWALLSLNSYSPFPSFIMLVRVYATFCKFGSSGSILQLTFKTKQLSVLCNRALLTLNTWWGFIRQTASPVDGDLWVPFVAITPTFAEYWLNFTFTTLRQMTCHFSWRYFVTIKCFTQLLTANLQPWTKPRSLVVNQWK